MTFLFVHHTADLYGASRSLLRLSSRLCAERHRVIAALPCDGPLGWELARSGVTVLHLSSLLAIHRSQLNPAGILRLLLRFPPSVIRFVQLIYRYRVDVVHTNSAVILSAGVAARLTGTPHVWHIREFFSEFPAMWRRYQRFMDRFSTVIVAVSSAVASQYSSDIRSRKVVVIPNGFPRTEFDGIAAERTEAFRRRWRLNSEPVVGLIGRIKLRRKGQDVFVKAVAHLKDRHPRARFMLIGSPFPGNEDQLDALNSLIEQLGIVDRIIYTGDIADIKAAYSALDFSVLPTVLPEAFGGVVIESMAMGKPVVGTRLGGTVEQIDEGVTGLLVPPDDVEGLAQAMDRLLSDPELRAKLGAAAKDRFLHCFEFEPFYKKMLQVYAFVSGCADSPARASAVISRG
jgi:glycosyltransferase involved in cell wall biosynthesis